MWRKTSEEKPDPDDEGFPNTVIAVVQYTPIAENQFGDTSQTFIAQYYYDGDWFSACNIPFEQTDYWCYEKDLIRSINATPPTEATNQD